MMVDSYPIVMLIVTVAGVAMMLKAGRRERRKREGYNKDKRAKCANKRSIAKTLQIRVEK